MLNWAPTAESAQWSPPASAVLDVVHPGHKLHDVFAVARAHLAVSRYGLGSTLLRGSHVPLHGLHVGSRAAAGSSGAGAGTSALRHLANLDLGLVSVHVLTAATAIR